MISKPSLPALFVLLLLCGAFGGPLSGQTFTRITTGNPIATDGGSPSSSYTGSSWIDYNQDGLLDLFINQGALYRGDGGGAFTKLAAPFAAQGSSFGNTWADIDNDGDLDCFLSGGGATGSLFYRNDGGDVFTKVTSGDIGQSIANRGWGTAWADYDNDGYVDLVIAAAFGFAGITTPNRLLHNNGDGTFTRIDTGVVVTGTAPYTIPSWSDFDQDGDMDLFIGAGPANGTLLPDYLYQNMLKESGTAYFTKITTGTVATDARDGQIFNWIDYDNDGDLDVYVTNYGGGALPGLKNDLYRNDGGAFTKIVTGAIVTDVAHSLSSLWQDFDNDGDLDCLVTNDASAPNRFYQNNNDGTFTSITIGTLVTISGPHFGASAADYDGDGDMDLFATGVGLPANNTKGLFRNDLAGGNSWLQVRCTGTASNRSAIGARVRALAVIQGAPVWQMREVSAQNSFNCQNSLAVHFGFGDATIIDSLKIEWPSGFVERFSGVAVNRLLYVVEGDSAPVVPLFPPDGGLNQLPQLPLRWQRDLYGPPYRLQVATDSTFAGGMVLDDSLVTDTARTLSVVSNNSIYYWRVRPAHGIHDDQWSAVRHFENQILPPALLFPPDGGSFPATVALRWAALSGATAYDVELATDSLFASLFAQGYDLPDTMLHVDSLVLHATYYWRVRAKSPEVAGAWSDGRYFSAEAIGAQTAIAARWNLLSIPVGVPSFAVDSIFPDALAGAYSFDADSGYSEDAVLKNLRGYWVKFASAETVQFAGSTIETSVSLKQGWNLIGAPAVPAVVDGFTTDPPGLLTTPAYGYESGYRRADTLAPGRGYWVKAGGDGILDLSPPSAAASVRASAAKRIVQHDLLNGLGTLVVRDAGGNERMLYFGGSCDVVVVDWWELPPVPPAGVFDARFAAGTYAEVSSVGAAREAPLRLAGSYPVTLAWSGGKGPPALLRVEGRTISMEGAGQVQLDAAPTRLAVILNSSDGAHVIPKEFSLQQNYPNPFNPATTIRFAVAEGERHVKIAVYDLLGREVAVLVDGQERSGYHDVSWDAGSAPAGVYYYRMVAGAFSRTERMVLVK